MRVLPDGVFNLPTCQQEWKARRYTAAKHEVQDYRSCIGGVSYALTNILALLYSCSDSLGRTGYVPIAHVLHYK